MVKNIAVIGSSGAIGSAMVELLAANYSHASVYACSSQPQTFNQSNVKALQMDYEHEDSIAKVSQKVWLGGPLSLVVVATGLLHSETIQPEKSLRDLSFEQFDVLFRANATIPAMLGKHFLPLMDRQSRSVFAAISARVGSISDNRLGGWYAYRASKAALNMFIKNASIEMQRRAAHPLVIGLHPGTVDSPLSKPFQKNVAAKKLFTPEYTASQLLKQLSLLDRDQLCHFIDYKGDVVTW